MHKMLTKGLYKKVNEYPKNILTVLYVHIFDNQETYISTKFKMLPTA